MTLRERRSRAHLTADVIPPSMKASDIVIAALWVMFLASAAAQGRAVPQEPYLPLAAAENMAPFLLLAPFAFFLPAAFFQRKRPFGNSAVRNWVDRKWGLGTHDKFIARLRPATLFMLAFLTLGVTGVISTYASTQSFEAYISSGFFLSAGLGLLVAYLLSLIFPPRLT